MSTLVIKQGDTFYPLLKWTENNGDIASLAGVVIASKVRNKQSKAIAFELATESRNDALGELQFAPVDTSSVPLGEYVWDMKISVNDIVTHTETKTIHIQEAVT